ncbi:MAG: SDR family oxidoreductase [Vulcanimicrobiaceae bacterium]
MATGRLALVTGAAGGLGRGIALGLARAGYRIAFTYRPGGTLPDRTFSQMTFADYRKMVDGNFGSAVFLAQAVLPSMREREFGRLIFFGMNGSHVALPSFGQSLYAASKAAVTSLARTLAVEEARHGITINVVQPGDIQNKEADRAVAVHLPGKNPTGHRGSWEDLAEAVVFFAGDAAGFINGQVLAVTGGLTEPYEG